jgi:chromosomal replication initiation ATPase DnaA
MKPMGRPLKLTPSQIPDLVSTAFSLVSQVAATHQVTLAELESRSRVWRIAWPRHLAIAAVRLRTGLPYKIIGAMFGRTPSDICRSCQQVASLTHTDRKLNTDWQRLLASQAPVSVTDSKGATTTYSAMQIERTPTLHF